MRCTDCADRRREDDVAMPLGQFAIEHIDTADGGAAQECLAFAMAPVGLRMRLRERF